jgi:peroxiredoxin
LPKVGEEAPDFILPSTDGQFQLSQAYRNRWVVLAFYTEDATPSCTQELASFKEEYPTIQELGAEVVAVSVDSLESHQAFCDRVGGYPFPLVSDTELEASQAYGMLSDDGKRSRRAVFVIDQQGVVVHAIPWYQPSNPMQLLEVFKALGLEV